MYKYFYIAFLILFPFILNAEHQWQYENSSQDIFNRIIEDTKKQSTSSIDLIYTLYLLDHPTSDQKLVDLSRYYLGSAPGHELSAAITNRGSTILPFIKRELKNPNPCKLSDCVSKDTILRRLTEWQKYINDGEKIEFIQ